MLGKMPELNARWSELLGEPMDLGVGINSGKARVGNTGSKLKFKYGPLGNTVNLASRVQGATKSLRARLLITGRATSAFAAQRQDPATLSRPRRQHCRAGRVIRTGARRATHLDRTQTVL